MRTFFCKGLAAAGVFLWAMTCMAGETPIPKAFVLDTPESIARRAHQEGNFDGVVTVTQHGKLIYAQGFGLADRQSHFPNTLDTPYRLCSLTKQFTALLVMQLVQSGQLRLDGTVGEYLPGALPAADGGITLKELLTHTSGLADLDDVSGFYQKTDPRFASPHYVLQTYLQGPLQSKPGEKFHYNNADYLVLQAILEKVTRKSYAALLDARILHPLGMRHSGVITQDRFAPKQAIGWLHQDGKVVPEPYYHLANFGAAGAMYSTARDLLRWNQALDRDTLLAKPYREIMFTADKSLGYVALGSWVYRGAFPGSPRKPLLIERQGEIGSFHTLNLRAPEDGVSIVVLSNTNTADLTTTYMKRGLAYDILKSLYTSKR